METNEVQLPAVRVPSHKLKEGKENCSYCSTSGQTDKHVIGVTKLLLNNNDPELEMGGTEWQKGGEAFGWEHVKGFLRSRTKNVLDLKLVVTCVFIPYIAHLCYTLLYVCQML